MSKDETQKENKKHFHLMSTLLYVHEHAIHLQGFIWQAWGVQSTFVSLPQGHLTLPWLDDPSDIGTFSWKHEPSYLWFQAIVIGVSWYLHKPLQRLLSGNTVYEKYVHVILGLGRLYYFFSTSAFQSRERWQFANKILGCLKKIIDIRLVLQTSCRNHVGLQCTM